MAHLRLAEKRVTAREAREQLLQYAPELIRMKGEAAIGKLSPDKTALAHCDPKQTEMVWQAIVPMLQAQNDICKVQAQNGAEVLALIGKGAVTLQEAVFLMQVLRAESDISDVKQMAQQLDELVSGYRG
jgi:hypothetical protein